MKTYKKIFSLLFVLTIVFFSSGVAHAVTPTFFLNNVNSASGVINIHGDPVASIELHHGTQTTLSAVTIGTTDTDGNFSMLLSASGYDISCNKIAYVLVGNQQSQTIPWSPPDTLCASNSSAGITFSKNSMTLAVGETQSAIIYGTGGYWISSNSNPNTTSVRFVDNQITIQGVSFGVATLNICESDGACGVINVTVVNRNISANYDNSQVPALSSLSILSDTIHQGFMAAGNTLTFGFTTTKPVTAVSVVVGSSRPAVTGSNNGTYVATYTITGNEILPIPVSISFTDSSGATGQASFSFGNNQSLSIAPSSIGTVAAPTQHVLLPDGCVSVFGFSTTNGRMCGSIATTTPVITPAVAAAAAALVQTQAQTPTPTSAASANTFSFSQFLSVNSTGNEVTQLQKSLTTLGFYSGPVTGKYGALTEAAVKKFQKARGITQTGYVGPATRAALNK